MRDEFHEHPDGLIGVRSKDGGAYIDTRENFEKDFGHAIPIPKLEFEFDDHIYTPGVRHCFILDGNVVAGGPDPWEYGDRAIADVGRLKALKETRDQQATETDNEEYERKRAAQELELRREQDELERMRADQELEIEREHDEFKRNRAAQEAQVKQQQEEFERNRAK